MQILENIKLYSPQEYLEQEETAECKSEVEVRNVGCKDLRVEIIYDVMI